MSKMTIAFEIEDKDSPLVKKLMESMKNGESFDGVKVYAVARDECLFDKMERIENVFLDETPHSEVASSIEEIINE